MFNDLNTATTAEPIFQAEYKGSNVADQNRHVRAIPGSSSQQLTVLVDSTWHRAVVTRILELLKMQPNWDSYGAPPISVHTAVFTLQLLDRLMVPGLPPPVVSPSSFGGLHLEWNDTDVELDLQIEGPYSGEFLLQDLSEDSGDPVEAPIGADLEPLGRAFARLAASYK
jgi:hypothetical protein